MRYKRYAASDINLSPPTRLFRTESFRVAALFAILLLGLSWTLLGVVYWIVNDAEVSTLVSAVNSDIDTIENGYKDEGISEAIEVVKQRMGPSENTSAGYYFLQDGNRRKLAGNLDLGEPTVGLRRFVLRRASHDMTIMGRGAYIADTVYVFVGRDTSPITATKARLLDAFAWIAGASILIAGAGGIFFGVQSMRRIDAIARTCESIVAGRLNDRIPLRGSGDELDRLANVVNDMLDRISTLLENLRQVSSDVAHDLRTPLTHLRSRLENARQKCLTAEQYAATVGDAIGDTDRLLGIFSALLRLSQIESGTRRAVFSQVSLTQLLTKIYELYAPVAEDHAQALERVIQEEVIVNGDAELLTQLFSNLVENSLRHAPAGAIIRIGATSAPGAAVAFVEDNGPGIPVLERENVLRRFYRLATSRSTPGNGLGLALVAAVAKLHQARVELADNHPGLAVRIVF
jgi:signal transduction histidine kinase